MARQDDERMILFWLLVTIYGLETVDGGVDRPMNSMLRPYDNEWYGSCTEGLRSETDGVTVRVSP